MTGWAQWWPGPDGDARAVEHRADVVRVHALDREGEHARPLRRAVPMSRTPGIAASRSVA